ncbi:MAG TPA: adenylate/guanylate cyclase domain-containing protein [Stellaceae bacterium]|nr:adenylate/guanylate cyclase domain-containing protein [Stellaceae bacterium]
MSQTRRLAAILAADVAGYSRLMGADEEGTLEPLTALRHDRVDRRLAAILAADVAGYSRLMGANEEGTLERLKALRRELLDPRIAEHHGRIVKTTGDGLLVEFASVVDAVRCAVAVQQAMPERETGIAADNRIELRIGINLGDVIVEGDDLYGDGVNIAARIEALADAGGVFVSNTVHDQVRDRLPFVFEDLGEQQVKNIARPVRVYRVRATLTHPDAHAPGSPLSRIAPHAGEGAERRRREAGEGSPPPALPDKPSIAVLPFTNLSEDPEQEYFVDGMAEEIITALSRIRWLFVIARNSSFTYKGQAVDVKQVGRELGVRYVLEGSVRKAANRVRIAGQLIDTSTGAHIWADRFDGSLEDVFDLQDQVAISVAGVIEPVVQAAETSRSAARRTEDLTAYDLYLRAYAMVLSSARQIPDALRLLEQAIDRDPRYGPALAWAAFCCARLLFDDRSEDREADRLKGVDFARRALEAAGKDPGILAEAAVALAYFGEDIGAMIVLVDRALALNPNFARGWHSSGILRLWAGQPDIAIEHIETSLRLSPRARVGASLLDIGAAHFFSRRFDEAVPKLLPAIQEDPSFPDPYRILAACYAHMGRLDDAREIVKRLRVITSVVIPDASFLRNPEDRELFLTGLRLATGEEA